MAELVAIIGASNKPDRYAYKAFKMLEEYGHETVLVHPSLSDIEGRKVLRSLSELELTQTKPDTISMYVRPEISSAQLGMLIKAKPKRIIFNPGSENPAIYSKLKDSGIDVVEACTLVLLRTNQF